jgi:hypothetical protein
MNAGYHAAKGALEAHRAALHQQACARGASKRCGHCGKSLSYATRKNRFCSRTCSARWLNGSKVEDLFCKQCERRLPRGNRKREFCSRACRDARLVKSWVEGSALGGTSVGIFSVLRAWLLRQAKWQCSACGWHEVNPSTGKVPLNIDHADGNSGNHAFANLRVLCPNCHSLTPTYGALNKGRGRKLRYR